MGVLDRPGWLPLRWLWWKHAIRGAQLGRRPGEAWGAVREGDVCEAWLVERLPDHVRVFDFTSGVVALGDGTSRFDLETLRRDFASTAAGAAPLASVRMTRARSTWAPSCSTSKRIPSPCPFSCAWAPGSRLGSASTAARRLPPTVALPRSRRGYALTQRWTPSTHFATPSARTLSRADARAATPSVAWFFAIWTRARRVYGGEADTRVRTRISARAGAHRPSIERYQGRGRSWRRSVARSKRLGAVCRGSQRVSARRRRKECPRPLRRDDAQAEAASATGAGADA